MVHLFLFDTRVTFSAIRLCSGEGNELTANMIYEREGKAAASSVKIGSLDGVRVQIVALKARIKLLRRALQSRPVPGTPSSPDFKCSYQRRRYAPTMVNRDKLQPPPMKFASRGEPWCPFEHAQSRTNLFRLRRGQFRDEIVRNLRSSKLSDDLLHR